MDNKEYIYHICLPKEWIERSVNGFYHHPSLESEGFIHCSTSAQLNDTIERFFADDEKIIILQIGVSHLVPELKFELAPTLNELFPHVYGPINIDAIMHVDAKTLRYQ